MFLKDKSLLHLGRETTALREYKQTNQDKRNRENQRFKREEPRRVEENLENNNNVMKADDSNQNPSDLNEHVE